jgi:hypothetical protein
MNKEIIPSLDLASKDFIKKVEYSLDQTGNLRVNPQILYNNEEGLVDNFAFALMNTQSSLKKICPVCNRVHHYLTTKPLTEQREGEKGLCEVCGIDLNNLFFFEVSKEKIDLWIRGQSCDNVFDLIRDAIQEKIKKGEVKISFKEK